ncbi:MAG: hypothetical protein M4579_006317 [Chaenotheca gracillima]|nr:MAG: hypothetical protein M4579_006317 [Chaenotheca gracillima]
MSLPMPGAWQDTPTEEKEPRFPTEEGAPELPTLGEDGRPSMLKSTSLPAYQSPIRHHKRGLSTPRKVKETLNARSEYTNNDDDGQAQHRINQYIIKQEIGRGSFGAVHLAVDQFGTEYAVKEFSKSRLRKRAQSNILRRPNAPQRRPGHLAAGLGFNSPMFRHDSSEQKQVGNPLSLIQEEIAIMKKLNHDNLVPLIEVLDDPEEDSLYMVLEMCKKGVIMKVGLEDKADGYDPEKCRCYFRDLLLGAEYLHAQGIVHRDIKPDNCLVTHDDVLKVSDFGVSEMFEKQSQMLTAKSAGSPAFLPPELCVAKHGDISGRAADIWSIGVTLYCLRFGRIPFEKTGILELYESIRSDSPSFEPDTEPDFVDLLNKLLEKDPTKRITMSELKEHPWVTKNGTDPLLSTEENIADLVELPTEAELNSAITKKFHNLVVVMKAAKKFKQLVSKKRPYLMDTALRQEPRTESPKSIPELAEERPDRLSKSQSVDMHDRHLTERALVSEGIHRDINVGDLDGTLPSQTHSVTSLSATSKEPIQEARSSSAPSVALPGAFADEREQGHKGQAHNPDEDSPLLLNVGVGAENSDEDEYLRHIVSESPPATDINIYETAYKDEVQRIRDLQGRKATVYLTRRVDKVKGFMQQKGLVEDGSEGSRPKIGWHGLLEKGGLVEGGSEGSRPRVSWHSLLEKGKAQMRTEEEK